MVRERNVQRVGTGHVVSKHPRGSEERDESRLTKVPTRKSVEGSLGERERDTPCNHMKVPQNAEYFGIEVFWNPELCIPGHELGQRPTSFRRSENLDARRGIDDHRGGHVWVDRRLRTTSAACSDVMGEAGRSQRISSSTSCAAAAEQSSLGFTTTMMGRSSLAGRAIPAG